jgi:hypothetical protein
LRAHAWLPFGGCEHASGFAKDDAGKPHKLRGKQCMTGVDPIAMMRQHAPHLSNKPREIEPFLPEMRK